MKPPVDLTGQKFGHLTVIEYVGYENKKPKWKCLCECGKYVEVYSYNLLKGSATSCGCFRRGRGFGKYKHGLYKDRIYFIYHSMKQRCLNKKCNQYKNYGARGITICSEWLGENGFVNFSNWAFENGYADDLSIDRIDNNGNYCPKNCRWTNMLTQANNTRHNRTVTYNGETHTYAEWEEILDNGVTQTDMSHRIKRGWNIERALLTPKKHLKKAKKYYWDKKIVHNGEAKSILEWCKESGINRHIYRHRVNSGWCEEDAATLPKQKGMSIAKRKAINNKLSERGL